MTGVPRRSGSDKAEFILWTARPICIAPLFTLVDYL
jgi:hypothetical protein